MLSHAIILLMLAGAPSGEEDEAARKAEAGKHLERGNKALEEGDPVGALDAYRAAYDAYPSPKIFFNMAEAHKEMGELVEAAKLYERVTNELPPDSPLVSAAQDRLTTLEAKLARISVATEPSGARIEIDGTEVGTSPVTDLRVAPGTLEIKATLDDKTQTRSIDVGAGDTRSVEIDLVEVALPPPPPPDVTIEEENDSIAGKWWFWTIIGVGVAAAGTTAAILATSGDDFVPTGELGTSSWRDWDKR